MSNHLSESFSLASILVEQGVNHQEGCWVRMIGKDNPETNPSTIKPKSVSHMAEQSSWVLLPYCSLLSHPFPIKSLALLAHVSPWTIHFRVLDKSPVLGPGRGSPLPATNGDSGRSLLQLTSWPLGVLRNQLACWWTRPNGCNWDPFVPGLLLTQTIGQNAVTR